MVGSAGVRELVICDDLLGVCPQRVPLGPGVQIAGQKQLRVPHTSLLQHLLMNLVLKWIRNNDCAAAIKSQMIYDIIDNPQEFYVCPVEPQNRSKMNIQYHKNLN